MHRACGALLSKAQEAARVVVCFRSGVVCRLALKAIVDNMENFTKKK